MHALRLNEQLIDLVCQENVDNKEDIVSKLGNKTENISNEDFSSEIVNDFSNKLKVIHIKVENT